MTTTKIILLIMLMIVVQSEGSCSSKPPSECTEFFHKTIEEQDAVFSTFSLDKQLEVYRCGMNRRPPEIGLAYAIAEGGEKIIPDLIEALRNEKDEWMQNAIIDIFRVMSLKGYLTNKDTAVDEVRKAVSQMKVFRIKSEAEQSLKTIEDAIKRNE